jgi:hypothetical protein
MKRRVVELAEQLLRTVPKDEVADLIRLSNHYNTTYVEADRARAMRAAHPRSPNPDLEEEAVAAFSTKTASSQSLYMIGVSTVCRCCGK